MLPPHIILGVEQNADQDSIKYAFRLLVKRFHPDLHPHNPLAHARFQKIISAYTAMLATSATKIAQTQQFTRTIQCTIVISFLESAHGCLRTIKIYNGKSIQLHIPPGITDGECINLKQYDLSTADVTLTIYVEKHPVFTRCGYDIYTKLFISLRDAILGTKTITPTIFGNIELYITPGTNTDTIIRIPKKGILGGNQYVIIKVMIPNKPTPSLIASIQD